jgi:protein TonB
MLAAPKPLTPPQLELITPPPVDIPPMPTIVLEEPPPTAQFAPAPVPATSAPATVTPATAAPATPITAAPTAAAQPASPPAAIVPPPTRVEAIAGTHTLPPYPIEAKRLAQSGTTQMQVAISTLGAATECTVVKSSGSVRLDAAACGHVQAHWRWKPATREGLPVAVTIAVTVVWSLPNAR